ncbi:MAG: hypothetical protein V2A73_04745 [Pseudomonadota bacterium]
MQRSSSWPAKTAAVLTAILGMVGGCAAGQGFFRPTERVVAEGPQGEPAASYELRGREGEIAQVNVWSEGAYRSRLDGGEATVVRLGLEVQNVGTEPIELRGEDLLLEQVRVDGGIGDARLLSLRPSDRGGTTIPSEDVRSFDLYFAVPRAVDPDDLTSFRLRWTLEAGGRRYVQFTPFVQDKVRDVYAYAYPNPIPLYPYTPIFGYYDPYLYDPFFPSRVYIHRVPVRRIVIVRHSRR